MMLEKMNEKGLLDKIGYLFEKNKISNLKKIFVKINLSTKEFRDIWSSWWEEEIPPRQEIDLILVFTNDIEKVRIVGVEVKYFKEKGKSPYLGLDQVLSFSLFGFDSLILWHIFSPNLKNTLVENYKKPVMELINGLNLPITYIATKIFEDNTFELFAPHSISFRYKVDSFLIYLEKSTKEKRNPLFYKEEVKRRRKVLKIILKIPW